VGDRHLKFHESRDNLRRHHGHTVVRAAGLAILYAATTRQDATEVLFSGRSAMGPLLQNSAGCSVAALLVLIRASPWRMGCR